MSVEDKQTLRTLMRELNRRRSLDISDMRIGVTRGVAFIGGVIRPSPGENLDPKAEIQSIKDSIRRIPGLKDVVFECRFDISSKH